MTRPTCSIVIPTRDCLKFLPTTLATVALQCRSDLEIVLVDDGSTDGTAAWAKTWSAPGVTLKLLETGGIGPSEARNVGVQAAQAQLIAFLDADDQWWAGKLDRQLAYHAANPQTGLSFTDYIHMTPDGVTLGTCFDFWKCDWTSARDGNYFEIKDAESRLLSCNLVGTSTVVVDRDVFEAAGGFSKEHKSAEDWALWLQLAARAPVACSTGVTMSYLMRPGSQTSNRQARVDAMRAIVDPYAGRTEDRFVRAVRQARARIAIAEAEIARDAGKPLGAATLHLSAALASPDWRTARSVASDIKAALAAPLRTYGGAK